ncbi:HAD family hydrolase [Gayadomonas joobiniege]|uniref:HAD family hydrolase n=1 Tax=Gayadomonas joobiniege TaxID=1234606 RepID=UPI00036199B7|nr:HAD family hydrolase [Gayadomonas joobiniege]
MSVNINLVIFDCDGVLIESEQLSAQVLVEQIAKHAGVQVSIDYVYQTFLGRKFQVVVDTLKKEFDISLSPEFEVNYQTTLLTRFSESLETTRGLKEMLNKLAVPACVATSSSPERTAHALKLVGLQDYFADRVFTASQVKNGKPAPDLFLHAAKTMMIAPEDCLVIEDSPAGMQAAISANMQLLHYCGGIHLKNSPISIHCPESAQVLADWQEFFNVYPQLAKR